MKDRWHKSKVIRGKGLAKTLGFPTINLDNPQILKGKRKGVYLSHIRIDEKEYFGLLYYGPRLVLGEEKDILEIYVIDHLADFYDEKIKFQLIKFIRGIMNFSSLQELKKQIIIDLSAAQKIIPSSN